MKNAIFRILCFVLLLTICVIGVDHVLQFKYTDGIYIMDKFYEQENDTVDVIILGSSHAFENFNTGTLWDEFGIAAYDLGSSNQPLWNTYYYLEEALKTQKPKLIVLEGSAVTNYADYDRDVVIINSTYGLRWSANKVKSLLASIPSGERGDYIPEFLRYHNRYSEISSTDFLKDQGDPMYCDWKGFTCNMRTQPFEKNDVSGVKEIGYMSPKSEWYYNHIIELAKESDIPIEIVIAPYPDCYDEEQKVYNKAEEIANDQGVSFTNGNLILDEMGIDYRTDAADTDHLNYRGNIKFSKYIGEYISSKYNLPDRRGDNKYNSWDNQARYIRRIISNQMFKEAETLDEYKQLIGTNDVSDYDVFVSTPEESNMDYYLELPRSDIHVTGESITVDGKVYDMTRNDINYVVYDRITARVEDYVGFDKADGYIAERVEEDI